MICMNAKILKLMYATMICQRLWLGNGFNACDSNVTSACKATQILNCIRETAVAKQISTLLKGLKRLPLVDKNILALLKDKLLFVDEVLHSPTDNVKFIHFRQGIPRFVSLICSYLMRKEGLSFHIVHYLMYHQKDIVRFQMINLQNN